MMGKKKWRPPNGHLKWIAGCRCGRTENKFWGEKMSVRTEVGSAVLGNLGEKVGVDLERGGCLNQSQGSQHRLSA